MSASAPRPRSFEDLYAEIRALPEGKTGMILVPGELTGVYWTWIVDPEARTLECYESVDHLSRQAVVAQAGDTATLPPFDLPVAIDPLWGAGA